MSHFQKIFQSKIDDVSHCKDTFLGLLQKVLSIWYSDQPKTQKTADSLEDISLLNMIPSTIITFKIFYCRFTCLLFDSISLRSKVPGTIRLLLNLDAQQANENEFA